MAGEWRHCHWGDIATLEYGRGIRGYHDARGPYPVYGTNGPVGRHHEALCKRPGVIIGRKGAYRGVHYSATPFYVIDTAFFLEPKVEFDLKWAYYELWTHDINGMDSGSAIPSTSRDSFYRLPVTLPPLSEQRAIAAILGALDDKIELNRRLNDSLEAMARALFQSWFVDFDPVRANMQGRHPAGMDAATAALFPAAFEDSPLGQIPKGWEVATFATLTSLSCAGINPGDFPDEQFDHYSIPAFDQGQMPAKDQGATIKSNKFVVLPDSILLSKLNPRFPRVWLPVLGSERRAVASTEFLVLTARQAVPREYLYELCSSDAFRESFASRVTGTSSSHQRVKAEDFLTIEVILPSEPALGAFTCQARSLIHRIQLNRQEATTLAAIRDALLPKLLSGELRVAQAQRLVEAGV